MFHSWANSQVLRKTNDARNAMSTCLIDFAMTWNGRCAGRPNSNEIDFGKRLRRKNLSGKKLSLSAVRWNDVPLLQLIASLNGPRRRTSAPVTIA
jgi:hypothetical protein